MKGRGYRYEFNSYVFFGFFDIPISEFVCFFSSSAEFVSPNSYVVFSTMGKAPQIFRPPSAAAWIRQSQFAFFFSLVKHQHHYKTWQRTKLRLLIVTRWVVREVFQSTLALLKGRAQRHRDETSAVRNSPRSDVTFFPFLLYIYTKKLFASVSTSSSRTPLKNFALKRPSRIAT